MAAIDTKGHPEQPSPQVELPGSLRGRKRPGRTVGKRAAAVAFPGPTRSGRPRQCAPGVRTKRPFVLALALIHFSGATGCHRAVIETAGNRDDRHSVGPTDSCRISSPRTPWIPLPGVRVRSPGS